MVFAFRKCAALLGFPNEPKKDADNAMNLAILGARVVVGAAAVDEKKAAKWSAT